MITLGADGRYLIPKMEFYITNVCNLSCENCNRFNDHNFQGWQNWNTLKHVYQQWAHKVRLGKVVILGGEPLLNPTIIDWIHGINDTFGVNVQVLSNGTRINNVRGLYDALLRQIDGVNNWLGISCHDMQEFAVIEYELQKFLAAPIMRGNPDRCADFGADFVFTDNNGITVPIWIQDHFTKSAVFLNEHGRFALHQNDVEHAHSVCPFVRNRNYHFIHGRLYKCGPVALFPEFDEQHDFDISVEDKQLLRAYRPLAIDEFETRGATFIADIDKSIPQCKFCPVDHELKKITVSHKAGRSRRIPINIMQGD